MKIRITAELNEMVWGFPEDLEDEEIIDILKEDIPEALFGSGEPVWEVIRDERAR